ncbi:MAG TPA: ribbon-helix-helix domain-containing protein [Candidatus Deferrimicrobium sp.]|nr:ribbon-helix-helix domain-containing protein [Candidatus Deferrimicrobium sp.]
MTMETLQIRLPKKLLAKVDELVKSGLFQSRSEIIREAVRNYIRESNYNGMVPFIIGPFTSDQIEILKRITFESLIPSEVVVEVLKKELKTLTLA